MSLTTIASDITPFFPGCPAPLVRTAVDWVVTDMANNGVQVPESFELCIEHGAKWWLYNMPGEKWSNPNAAESSRLQYLTARGKAKLEEANASDRRTKVPEF